MLKRNSTGRLTEL